MNSLTKRKITAVVVSLMLVVAIVTTGILCAPRFNTPNEEINLNTVDYNAYEGEYKVGRVVYTNKNTTMIRIADSRNNGDGTEVWYPTDIYLDSTETLQSAGYYVHFSTNVSSAFKSGVNKNNRALFWHNILGKYSNDTIYNAVDDAARVISDSFESYGFKTYNDGFSSLKDDNATAGGASNTSYNSIFLGSVSSSKKDPRFTVALQGSRKQTTADGDYVYRTFTWTNSEEQSKIALYEFWYDDWGDKKNGTATDFSVATSDSVSWVRAPQDSNSTMSGSTEADCVAVNQIPKKQGGEGNILDKEKETPDLEIRIHLYNKTNLLTAVNNLQNAVNELSAIAINSSTNAEINSIAVANGKIAEAKRILKTREVTAEEVKNMTDDLNSFVFDIERPATSFTAWTFGERDNGGRTYLNTLWGNYNDTYAKYFNVDINHKVYGEFDTTKTGSYAETNRPLVSDKDTYDKYAYVQDAGDYIIRFTPKDPSTDNSGITHGVRWLTAGNATAEMTLTINRVNMDVYPAAVADRPYTGAAQQFAMTTDGSVVSLKGGMKSENAELVVKLLKYDPGADNSKDWDNAAENQIEFTEVGEHKVYYRIQAKNHLRYLGEYYVKIVPGNVTITFGAQSIDENASGGVLTYGDAVLSSEDIIAQGVTGVKLNGVDSDVVNKDTLKNILTIGLYANNAFVTDNLTAAGNHGVRVKDFMSVTQSAVEQEENSDINSWNQRINVALVDESSCYKIAKKEINIVWGELAEQVYNGLGNHRPTADVKAGDEVVGGERFAITTYILKGEEVGLSGDNAGRITVDGIEYEVPLTTGGNAIWAGEYKVGVRNREDSNYTVIESSRTTDFKIKQRELSVDVLDRDSDYAHAINEERSVNAENVRDIYQNVMFNNNQGINKVYELLNDTSLASADTADIVFELDIVNVDTTDPDHSKSDSFYCAGVHKDALVARLRTAGELDTKGNPVDMNRIRSYSLTYEAGTFTVYPAEIESSRSYMRKTFDGTEQEFALTPTRIGLTGWEEIHKNEGGVVKFTYSRSINGPFSEDPITIRNYNGNGEIIYYQVEAPNHKKTEVKSFVAYIDRLALDITIGQQDTVFYYGDNIPDSDGIVSALNITYVPRKSDFDEDQTPSDFVIDGKLQFFITNAGQKVTDRKIGAGLYTISLEPVDTTVNSLDNYNITYSGRNGSGKDNENAFEISQRPLIVDWRQSGSNWLADGMHFVYNATTPGIQPTVRMYRNADLSIYNENSTGANTSDDNTEGTVENYVDGDNIALRPQTLGGSTYNADGYPTEKTELSNPTNAKNYVLVNPTSRYYIDQRTVKINVFDQSATYGTAKSVAMGALISSKEAGANWEYNAGNDYEFIREHYNNWALTSEAIEGGATDYHDVKADGYPIVLSQRDGNDGAVASNYNIIVYRKHKDGTVESEPSEHSNAAIFMIEKATLNLARREFNFDASPKNPDDPDDTTAKENCYLDVEEIRKIVKVVGATTQGQVSIMMSEPIQYGESGQVTGSAADYQLTNDRVIDIKTAGKYYVWIKMTNSNYEEFEGTLDVSYLTNWISILLDGQITANYGDTVMTSDELFENLKVEKITGVMNDAGNGELTNVADAWKAIQDRQYFTLFVGKGDKTPLKTNERVDVFSVYMNINKDNVGSGEDELHFRFIGNEIGKGVTSNVNAYKVIERPVYLVWEFNVNELYGEHGNSTSTGYTVMNVLENDNVRVEIKYEEDKTSATPGEINGNLYYVGDYIATLVGVSQNANYRVAVIGDRIPQKDGSVVTINNSHLVKKFSVNAREITVTIEDQQLVYGSLDARATAVGSSSNNIYNFVNASSVYTIGGDGLYDEDIASEIFELKAIYSLEQGCNYLAVDTYRIRGSKKNSKIANQYEVKFLRKGGDSSEHDAQLEITPADFTIDSMTFNTIYFDGKWHSPLGTGDNIAALSYTFAGDAEYANENRRVYFNADVNATAASNGWKLVKDKDNFYEDALKFRNAGINRFAVMVETLNHNPRVRNDITFEILSVNVNIDMTDTAKKIYGEVIEFNGEKGTEKAISDFIKANTGLTYEVTTGRDPWSVENLDDSFIFYVVAGGENGVDSGEGIEAGNFANNVGYYRVYHKFADGEEGNYNVTYTQNNGVGCNAKAFRIDPKEVNVTWHLKVGETLTDAPTAFTYSGKSPLEMGLTAKFVGIKYNEATKELVEYDEILVIDGAQSPDARKTPYTVSANFGIMKTVATNYYLKPSTTSFQYVINPRDIVVIIKDQSVTYGSEIVFDDGTDAWEVDDNEWDSIPNANIKLELKLPTVEAGKFVPSKVYEIQAECGNTNFNVSYKAQDGTNGWGKYTVEKAEIKNVPTHMDDLKYNGADQNVDIYKHISEHLDTALDIKGDMTWEQAKVTYKNESGQYVSAMPTVKNAGETIVEFKITLANHIDYEGKMSVNVSQASIVFNADVVEVQYGYDALESAELFKKMNIRINREESDPIAVDLDKLVSFRISENAKNVGQYYLQTDIIGNSGDNFNVTLSKDAGQTQTPYHIVPRVITVDWGNTTRVYKGAEWYFTANGDGFGNVVKGETISNPTYSLIIDGKEYPSRASEVGEYQVKIVVNNDNRNYVVDEACRYQTFTIVPKEVEIEWNVENFKYDGNGHMLEARIVGGVLSGDSCSIITYSPKVVSAGTHVASIVKLDNANYTVPASATAEFTIEQKEVHIVWVVENFVYDGTTQCIKAYVNTSDLVGDDTCEVVVSGGGIDAGTHRAIVSELKNPNYKLPEGGAGQEFSIAPRVIKSIVWTNTSLTYNEINGVPQSQVPTASVGDGMVDGDTVEFEITVAQGNAINAGSYRATVVGVNNKNYVLDVLVSNDTTNFEIKKAENSLGNDIKLPVKDGGLPALADFESVLAKYGSPVVKYYTNAELTDEYTGNLNDAPKGKYYVVVMVEGTENYDTVSRTFEVDVDGKSNKTGLIVGIVVPIAVLAIAGAVVAIILVKKKKGNKAAQA